MSRRLACSSLVLAASLCSAGCGDDSGTGGGPNADPLEARFTSGSRLRIKVLRAGDAEQFAGVYDSELEVGCDIVEASDGALRCVPLGDAYIVYADSGCSEPVVTYYPSDCNDDGPGKFATLREVLDVCTYASRVSVYEVGAKQAPATVFDRDATGTCYEVGPVAEIFAAGAELDPSAMAELELVEVPRGDALSVSYHRSDDGFHLLADYPRDTAHQVDCYPGALGGEPRCVPLGIGGATDRFADSDCTVAGVFSGADADCPQLALGPATESDGCTSETHVYELGEALALTYYESDDGTCVEATDATPNPHAFGAQLPDADFPAVEVVEEGEGAVRFSTFYAAGAPVTRYGGFVTADGEPCYSYGFADGTQRCGPATIAYVAPAPGRSYADAACSDVLVPLYDSACPGSEPNRAVVASGVCGLNEGVYEIGAPHDGAVFTDDASAGCVEIVTEGVSFKLLGERIPDDEFVEVTLETL